MRKVFQTCLLFVFVISAKLASAQMVLEFEIPDGGVTIGLPLSGTVDVLIQWGDGFTGQLKVNS